MKILDDIYTEFDQESYDETLRNDGRIQNAIANAKILLEDGKYSAEEISTLLHIPIEAFIMTQSSHK